jgi:hypothetical protein
MYHHLFFQAASASAAICSALSSTIAGVCHSWPYFSHNCNLKCYSLSPPPAQPQSCMLFLPLFVMITIIDTSSTLSTSRLSTPSLFLVPIPSLCLYLCLCHPLIEFYNACACWNRPNRCNTRARALTLSLYCHVCVSSHFSLIPGLVACCIMYFFVILILWHKLRHFVIIQFCSY